MDYEIAIKNAKGAFHEADLHSEKTDVWKTFVSMHTMNDDIKSLIRTINK